MAIKDLAFKGLPLDIPVIDAHTHIMGCYYMGWYEAYTSNDDVIKLMDSLGIDSIVTCPHSISLGRMYETNAYTAKTANEYPGRIYGYIALCPHEGLEAVRSNLDGYSRDESFIGLKLLPGYHGPLSGREYSYALDFAAEMKCPVLCHIWSGSPSMAEVEKAAAARPSLKLMMAHQGGGFAADTDAYAALMRRYPNLLMEICGSMFNSYSMEEIVEMAGEDRVIFGTDMINLDPRYDFGKVVFSSLDDVIKRKILAGNFLRILEGSGMGRIKKYKLQMEELP